MPTHVAQKSTKKSSRIGNFRISTHADHNECTMRSGVSIVRAAKKARAENEASIDSMSGECSADVWSLPEDREKTTLYLDKVVKRGVVALVKSKRISGCSNLSQLTNGLFRALLDPKYAVRIGFWTLVQVNAPLYYVGGRRRPKEKGWVKPVENYYDQRVGNWIYKKNAILNKKGHAVGCGCSECTSAERVVDPVFLRRQLTIVEKLFWKLNRESRKHWIAKAKEFSELEEAEKVLRKSDERNHRVCRGNS